MRPPIIAKRPMIPPATPPAIAPTFGPLSSLSVRAGADVDDGLGFADGVTVTTTPLMVTVRTVVGLLSGGWLVGAGCEEACEEACEGALLVWRDR